jgi:hypothetical protein
VTGVLSRVRVPGVTGCMVKGMKLPPTDLSKMIGNKGVCSACLHGKQHVQPFKPTGSTCSRKLEVVHMDLMGPITPETNDEEKYALNIIDEHSEMSATILLKSKADTVKEATNLLNQWQNQHECKGCRQIYGIDYTEVYAPVSKHSTLRYILSKAVHRNMHVHQMDVSTSFLHGDVTEKVFIQQPEGFHVGGPNTVCRLHKALYGLKQAPRARDNQQLFENCRFHHF